VTTPGGISASEDRRRDFDSEGRTTDSAIGNQANLAARIQDRCKPGRVLISHPTWGPVKDEITCTEHGEIEVKGIHYPARAYEVLEPDPGD
jgi:class 3 adenylate cyclase